MFVIAGATGHVGGTAARELLAQKQKVKVIVRDAAKGKDWAAKGAEVAVGELGDTAFLTGALKGATGFFTLLPPDFGASDVFTGQKKLADAITAAVKQSGVPHVVLLSSLGADLEKGTGPIKGLHYFENTLRAAGTKLSAIRAAYFMENIGNSVGAAKGMGIFPNFMASQDAPMPMIATKDIGTLAAKVLRNPPGKNENIDLIGPFHSVKESAELLGKAVGKQLNIVDIPPPGHVAAMTQAGVPKPMAEAFAEMYNAFNTGLVAPKGDRRETGTTPFADVIAQVAKG
jgi:uncharacterized protein YbjT (DUF2867 family)